MRFIKSILSRKDTHKTSRLIVLGHQKTGTTALAALLSKISGLTMSSDPLYFIDQGKAKAVEALMSSPNTIIDLCRKYPARFNKEIIKDPDFIFIYPALKECFQNAKFLFIIRDPRDTIRSICNRLALSGKGNATNLTASDMKRGNHHWELILSGQLPKLKNVDPSRLGYIENLAYRWCLATEHYISNQDEMTLVRYEDFRLSKEDTIKNLAEKLNLPIRNSISEHVDIQYQPKGNADIDWKVFFGADNLIKIENICSKHMNQFGYMKIHN